MFSFIPKYVFAATAAVGGLFGFKSKHYEPRDVKIVLENGRDVTFRQKAEHQDDPSAIFPPRGAHSDHKYVVECSGTSSSYSAHAYREMSQLDWDWETRNGVVKIAPSAPIEKIPFVSCVAYHDRGLGSNQKLRRAYHDNYQRVDKELEEVAWKKADKYIDAYQQYMNVPADSPEKDTYEKALHHAQEAYNNLPQELSELVEKKEQELE